MSVSDPKVFLVGAGPGNPGLLTLRAAEVLAQADLVLHDQLVPRRLLDLARPGAETMCVRELPGNHPDKYPHIHNLLIERARAGQTVVRLKGGDPLIFGRGGEEAEALRQAGIAYEIVPGITAALAAGAFLDIPLTHRNFASAVALVTGHELPHKPGNPLDWKALAAFPGTLCIYMGVARLPVIVAELLKHGKDPATPACIVERASTGDQRTVYSRLDVLEEARRNAGLEAPGLIVVGEAVSRRPERSWWESRPLFGRRVLVTRPAHQAGEMVRKLERLGAVVYRLPAVEIRPPADWSPVDRVIHELSGAGLVQGGTGVSQVDGRPPATLSPSESLLGGTGVSPVEGRPPASISPSESVLGGTGVSPVHDSLTGESIRRRNLPHIEKPGRTYHITFRTKDVILSEAARVAVLSACRFWDGKKLHLHAAVIMPDHVHLLLTPNTVHHSEVAAESTALSTLLHSIKGFSAKEVNRLMGRTGTVWMDESYDRYTRSEADFDEKYEYIANNPVKAGLVQLVGEYPHLYLKHAIVAGVSVSQQHTPGPHRLEAGATQDTGEDAGATRGQDTGDTTQHTPGPHRLEASATHWIVFTSANGVHGFLNRIEALGLDLRILGGVKLAAIGPKTAAALREYRLNADIVPDTYNSEGLVAALRTAASRQRVLLARANRGRELLRDELAKVADVRQVVVYDQVDSVEPDADVLDHLRRGEVHYVTLSSSKIAENLLRSFDETMRGRVERGEIELVAISPETGKAIRSLGFRVTAEAERFTADGLIDAVVRLAERTPA